MHKSRGRGKGNGKIGATVMKGQKVGGVAFKIFLKRSSFSCYL